ncbi:multicopper oxidase [Xylariaceae sp. FL0255]|nr:multicopper oxidase [Xylariaceae sp. FL0255]
MCKARRWAMLAFIAIPAFGLSPLDASTLPQVATNGNFTWGTFDAPQLPKYLLDHHSLHNAPWGTINGSSNPAVSPPITGITRYYDFDVQRKLLSPDGFQKSGIFVNGQFPGPTIEANWGDWIEVRLHNNIETELGGEAEGTSMHFHGITQKGTPWSDGVPGFTQCPIAPGSSFTYRFRADVYGTSWWHSHYSAQYTAGIWGPIIIYGPNHVDYDVDIGPIMVGDYYHSEYHDIVEAAVSNSTDFTVYVPVSDNSLINGKNNYNCSLAPSNSTCYSHAELAQFHFQPGKVHRLRLINTGAAALIHFSIDGHRMQVIANDFVPVVPYEVNYVTLHVGQRTDILVDANANPKISYWMRSTISLNCSVTTTTGALAIVTYDRDRTPKLPTTNISIAAAKADEKAFLCQNDELNNTVPFYPSPVETPEAVETITVDLFTNATGNHVWIMNNSTEYTDYSTPLLLPLSRGIDIARLPSSSQDNLYDFENNKTVRIVLNTVYQSAHPMHLHGHHFQVLSAGPGAWDGSTIINPENPLRRDTHIQPRYGHLVIQFVLDNPGVWTYHCHIAWHASMGLNIGIIERPKDLISPAIPPIIDETCVKWDAWTKRHEVDQVDAGI